MFTALKSSQSYFFLSNTFRTPLESNYFGDIGKCGHRKIKDKTTFGPVHEKTNNLGFRLGVTKTGLYSDRIWLEAGHFVFRN